nr:ATP-grasp fold amidoligase family protein [Odoribacter splanchnicus]
MVIRRKDLFKLLLKNPYGFLFFMLRGLGLDKFLSDKSHILLEYRYRMEGEKCNLKDSKLFSEKLQWLKLNDRRLEYHQMVDKYEAKKYIASVIGESYTIPTLGVWDKYDDIEFDKLPEQFVLKCTHDSGSYVICKDKTTFNWLEARKKLCKSLKKNYFLKNREWQYKGLYPRIIAEPYLIDSKTHTLNDYKFFCFNGKPKLFQICWDRNPQLGGALIDFFDVEGHYLEIKDKYHNREKEKIAELPVQLDKMLEFSRILSKGYPTMRVDFYEVNGKLYVGELTLHENAGFCAFSPEKYNLLMGDWIELDKINSSICH